MSDTNNVIASSEIIRRGLGGLFAKEKEVKVFWDRMEFANKTQSEISWKEIQTFLLDARAAIIELANGKRVIIGMTKNPLVLGLAWMLWNYRETELFEDVGRIDFRRANEKMILRSFKRDGEVAFRDAGSVLTFESKKLFLPSARTVAVREVHSIGGMKTSMTGQDIIRFEPEPLLLPLQEIAQSIIVSGLDPEKKKAYLDLLVENHGAGWEGEEVHGLEVVWN